MIPKDTLRQIAQEAHRYAKAMVRYGDTYRHHLADGLYHAWREYYTTTKEVVAETVEDVYRACTAFKSGYSKSVTISRDLRKKLNYEVLVRANACTRKLVIRFAATGVLKTLMKRCDTSTSSLESFFRAITIASPNIERNIILDELLADLA